MAAKGTDPIICERILRDYRAGLLIEAITERHGVGESTVNDVVRKAGVPLRSAKSPWTKEKIATLRLRCEEKVGFLAIALELDVTKNSVIGKAHRLKISNGHPSGNPRCSPGAKRRPRTAQSRDNGLAKVPTRLIKAWVAPKAVVAPAIRIDAPVPLGLTLFELTSLSCRYPFGESAPFSYCGLSTLVLGASWCPHHRAIVFRSVTPQQAPYPMRRAA